MKSQIPRGVPGILPFVRHRNHMIVDHMRPVAIPNVTRGSGSSKRVSPMFFKPSICIKEIVLFAPQHSRKSLPHHLGLVGASLGGRDRTVEVVRLMDSCIEYGPCVPEWRRRFL